MSTRPVFIVGVPRSGTTLLRTLLDSHPNIACGPENPWIAGSYGELTSFKELYSSLVQNPYGPVANMSGVGEADIARSLEKAITSIFATYARQKGKKRWVEKTPNHVIDLEFLHTIFPEALYLHIVRDGRDVACSTYNGRKRWGRIVDIDGSLEITRNNAIERWARWEKLIEQHVCNNALPSHTLRYEDLLEKPKEEMRKLVEFIGERFDPEMLRYGSTTHDYPSWEVGSHDVREKGDLSFLSVSRWKKEYPEEELATIPLFVKKMLSSHGYE